MMPMTCSKPSGDVPQAGRKTSSQATSALAGPVGVTFDNTGALLLVADDVGNVTWRVTPAQRRK